MDAKADQKVINDLPNIVQENRGADEKSLHSVKSGNSKKDEKDKLLHSERDDYESRHISADHKVPATSTIKQHVRQPHLAFPDERITDSPNVSNPCANDQVKDPPLPISGQVDDHNKPESSSLSSHHCKSDNTDMKQSISPAAHKTKPNIVLPATIRTDGRTSNPAHSPSSHIHKKESSHNQRAPTLQNPATLKRPKFEHSDDEHSRTHLSHPNPSISPGPAGLVPSLSPFPWHMTSNSHSSIPQAPHGMLSTIEQSNCRMSPQGSSVSPIPDDLARAHSPLQWNLPNSQGQPQPLSAHSMPQPPFPARVRQPYSIQDIARRHPVLWQGPLSLKNAQAAVQMHFVSGNPIIARRSLPPIMDGIETAPIRISQRMKLEPAQLGAVYKKLQKSTEHCILMALPCGGNQNDLVLQSVSLRSEFINYLADKRAAGIANVVEAGCQQAPFVIHVFPSCEFIQNNLNRIAPGLFDIVQEKSHLVIIIATV